MSERPQHDDERLLRDLRPETAGESFERFYLRHEVALLAYFRRRVATAELAADLTAETFAQALASRHRFRSRGAGAGAAWLYGIAANLLKRSYRSGHVEDRARRSLGLDALSLTDHQADLVDELVGDARVEEILGALPDAQRDAIRSHILEDRSYADIAGELRCSEAVVRQRVSRGLGTLRQHELEGTS